MSLRAAAPHTAAVPSAATAHTTVGLRRYPLDILKIDRSFVDRLGGEREDEALAAAIVRLGRDLGMATVAEGIEDDVQLTTLQDLGCDFAQGYRLSRPLPAAEAGRVLVEGLPSGLTFAESVVGHSWR